MKSMPQMAFVVVAAVAAGLLLSMGIGASATAVAGTPYYVDCSASTSGSGSQTSPWNTLASASAKTYSPGDSINLKAGTTCQGTLSPKGSGTTSEPIVITQYGVGALPVVNGGGAPVVIGLTNQDHWVIQSLKLTDPASTLARRDGLSITATDGKAHSGFDVENLVVDDVAGQTNKLGATGGDFSHSSGIEMDSSNGSTLSDVHVKGNRVGNTGGGGIKVRAGMVASDGTTILHGHNLLIEHNTVTGVGGDGIIGEYADSPVLQYNTATNTGGGTYPYSGGAFAEIWVMADVNPIIQYNVVQDTTVAGGDGEAFDCDWGNTGTCLVQYNYSRNNVHGFFLDCNGCSQTIKVPNAQEVVRYNVNVGTCSIKSNWRDPSQAKLEFYNNTMYCPNSKYDIELPANTSLTNNIFVGTNDSILPTANGITYLWNAFQGVPRPTANGYVGDPHFVNPTSTGTTLSGADGFKLQSGSPLLGNGAIIAGGATKDYWGNSVSTTARPNRGAYDGPGIG